jgi:DNA-binding PadR family transcriptional regulator
MMHHFEHEDKVAKKWLKESQKGYIRLALLILLSEKPFHGYEMMKEVEDRTEGIWKPTPGGVYPILQSLEKAGYIEGKWDKQKRKRKEYVITQAGKLILDRSLVKHNEIAESMNTLFEEYAKTVLDMEPNSVTLPQVPNPFLNFMQKKKAGSRLEFLELKRERIVHMIKMLDKELQTLDDKLASLQKSQKTPSDTSGKKMRE